MFEGITFWWDIMPLIIAALIWAVIMWAMYKASKRQVRGIIAEDTSHGARYLQAVREALRQAEEDEQGGRCEEERGKP